MDLHIDILPVAPPGMSSLSGLGSLPLGAAAFSPLGAAGNSLQKSVMTALPFNMKPVWSSVCSTVEVTRPFIAHHHQNSWLNKKQASSRSCFALSTEAWDAGRRVRSPHPSEMCACVRSRQGSVMSLAGRGLMLQFGLRCALVRGTKGPRAEGLPGSSCKPFLL